VTSSPLSPRLLKGAIVSIDPLNPLAGVVVFQYNPDTLRRNLQAQATGIERQDKNNKKSKVVRLTGAPLETIDLEIEIDATDQLEKAEGVTTSMGIYPQLSALEMLLYPKSAWVVTNSVLMALGKTEMIPSLPSMTLFVWGPKRVLPVSLSNFSITEEAHDVNLNPIRAKVSLGLNVLSYNDLSLIHPGYSLFLAHQVVKETMAVIGSAGNLGNIRL
jgi:hypothetical protein